MAHLLKFPEGITLAIFLRDYWQKKPLLFRQCLDFDSHILSAEELAGLACEAGVESRLIIEKHAAKPWQVSSGPFTEEDFSQLPESHWTLLVQDVDKHVPAMADLLKSFNFLPSWRIDDVMVSFAQDQGSVGPHTDDYDVFLYQYAGKRRWNIHYQETTDDDFMNGLDMKQLKEFMVEDSWLLEAGDMLYLPPSLAHWGVAEGDCLTCSIGFVAPNYQELLTEWCEDQVNELFQSEYYKDIDLSVRANSGEVMPSVLHDFSEHLSALCEQASSSKNLRWFSRYVSETKHNLQYAILSDPISPSSFLQYVMRDSTLIRNSYSRMMYCLQDTGYFYVNGQEYAVNFPAEDLFRYLTEESEYRLSVLEPWLNDSESLAFLTTLYNDQHIMIDSLLEQ